MYTNLKSVFPKIWDFISFCSMLQLSAKFKQEKGSSKQYSYLGDISYHVKPTVYYLFQINFLFYKKWNCASLSFHLALARDVSEETLTGPDFKRTLFYTRVSVTGGFFKDFEKNVPFSWERSICLICFWHL